MPLGTINSLKDSAQGYTPLLLVAFTFQDAGHTYPTLLLSTRNVSSFPGLGDLPAGDYIGRLAEQNIGQLQLRSNLGVSRYSKVSVDIWDADKVVWNGICETYGFRGATMVVALVMWQPGTNNFSTDSKSMFIGTCDMEILGQGGDTIKVNANNAHNATMVKLPILPNGSRCDRYFPTTSAERALAMEGLGKAAEWCPYSPDIAGGVGNTGPANQTDNYGSPITDASGYYIRCDYLRSDPTKSDQTVGCMARLGNYGTANVAPDGDLMHDTTGRRTGSFTGITWSPGSFYAIARNYVSGQKVTVFSFLNSSVIGTFVNLLYGQQFVDGEVVYVVESGNDSKIAAIVCSGDIGTSGVNLVIVQGIMVPQDPSGDKNLWWDYPSNERSGGTDVATGSRFGVAMSGLDGFNSSNGFNQLPDPLASKAVIYINVYKDIFTGSGLPSVRIRATGPKIYVYVPIATAVGNGSSITVTFANNQPNGDCAGNPPFTVTIFDNSWATANATWGLTSWAAGPPGTITLTSSAFTGSGTGGFIRYESGYDTSAGAPANTNPAWVLMDLLVAKCSWSLSEINLASFMKSSRYNFAAVSYFTADGSASTHPRFKCQFYLSGSQRKSAAEVIEGVLKCCRGYLYIDSNGSINLGNRGTLADQQPSVVAGSNYNTAVSSKLATGVVTNGYFAYLFDEGSIRAIKTPDGVTLDIVAVDSATNMTPNQFTLQFQNEDNQFAQDSITLTDKKSVDRSSGALQPGGSVVQENFGAFGVSNFDQGIRLMNCEIAERQYGNSRGDGSGTMVYRIGTTVKCSNLQIGSIVGLTIFSLNFSLQPFRVLAIEPARDFSGAYVTIQYHDDDWYTDTYGQTGEQSTLTAAKDTAQRVPLPWQPGYRHFNESNIVWDQYEYNMAVAQVNTPQNDTSVQVAVQVTGYLPINQISTSVTPPVVPPTGTTATTGGSIEGGITWYIQLCARDINGRISAPSKFVQVVVPSGTNTNTITISGIVWSPGSVNYNYFIGTDHMSMARQGSGSSGTVIPGSTITLTTNTYPLRTSPPDLFSGSMTTRVKKIWHAGIIGSTVVATSSTTITIGAPASGTLSNTLTNYSILLIGRDGAAELDPVSYGIISYTIGGSGEVIFTVGTSVGDEPNVMLQVGDAVVILPRANIHSSTTIGDANAVNAFYPSGAFSVVAQIRIIAGKGRYQLRTAESVSGGTTYTVTQPWADEPDNTSIFIVESLYTDYTSSASNTNASDAVTSAQSFLLPIANIADQTVLVQAVTGDGSGTIHSVLNRAPLRILYIYGKASTQNGYLTITPSAGNLSIDLTEYGNFRYVMSASAVALLPPTSSIAIKAGDWFTLYLDQDATGSRLIPTFTGGVGGFSSNTNNTVQIDPTPNTRTSLVFTFHGSYWGLDSQQTGVSLT